MEHSNLPRKRTNKLYFLLILVLFLILIFSGIKIFKYITDTKDNKNIQKSITNLVEVVPSYDIKKVQYKINFDALKDKNPDTVGYLKVNGTDIEYAVLQSNNNEYYLTHNFNKKYSASGWVYADYHNKFDGSDQNIVIYGHNMRNNLMFGTLEKVLKSSWQDNEDNLIITFITENEYATYQVFSTYMKVPDEYYISTSFANDDEYNKFLNDMVNRSNKDYGVSVTTDDEILTLSSCNSTGMKRIVLHAKKIKL